MGQYFFYANLDRKEYFNIGLGFQNNKTSGIGGHFGARALGLLLRDGAAWARQRVVVIGDETAEYEDVVRPQFHAIDSAVILMLFGEDRENLMKAARENTYLFLILAELAIVHGATEVAGSLQRAFGADWKKTYGHVRRKSRAVVLPP